MLKERRDEFRAGYRQWRQGGSKGAHGETSGMTRLRPADAARRKPILASKLSEIPAKQRPAKLATVDTPEQLLSAQLPVDDEAAAAAADDIGCFDHEAGVAVRAGRPRGSGWRFVFVEGLALAGATFAMWSACAAVSDAIPLTAQCHACQYIIFYILLLSNGFIKP
jgi:hypothetical protein